MAARIMSAAAAGEILVSAIVPPIVGGSATIFEPRGRHALKGVPGEWDLFAATEVRASA